jgi:hypothetical protein
MKSYPLYRTHWHLGYCNKTACGILIYKTAVANEFDTATCTRLECSLKPTCRRCQKVMRIGKFERAGSRREGRRKRCQFYIAFCSLQSSRYG